MVFVEDFAGSVVGSVVRPVFAVESVTVTESTVVVVSSVAEFLLFFVTTIGTVRH